MVQLIAAGRNEVEGRLPNVAWIRSGEAVGQVVVVPTVERLQHGLALAAQVVRDAQTRRGIGHLQEVLPGNSRAGGEDEARRGAAR